MRSPGRRRSRAWPARGPMAQGSFGCDSEAGSQFAERLLTVVACCRQQGRGLLNFLVAAGEAALYGTAAPSLLPAGHGAERLPPSVPPPASATTPPSPVPSTTLSDAPGTPTTCVDSMGNERPSSHWLCRAIAGAVPVATADAAPSPTTSIAVGLPSTPTNMPSGPATGNSSGCGSQGGPGYRLRNGRCASWDD
jgi:hypothetical protein